MEYIFCDGMLSNQKQISIKIHTRMINQITYIYI